MTITMLLVGLCAVLAVAAGIATVAAWRLTKDHALLEAHVREMGEATEKLNDRLFAVAESEERYRSLIEAQGDLIVRRSRDGRIVYANAAYAELLEASPEALIGSIRQLEPLTTHNLEVRPDGTRLFDERLVFHGDADANRAEAERWISWAETVVPMPDGTQLVQRVGRDVTIRVASEQELDEALSHARSASEAKSRFLATVSHEFRTPLNGIIGMADLLADTRLDAEQTTYVRALRTSGQALLSLIEDILDFAKVEAGHTTLSQEPFDLVSLSEGVVELLAPRAHDKGLALAMRADQNLPARIVGDPDRVRQIIVNLVGNAVKFTEVGGVGLRLGWDGEAITIVVEDTGPGIPADRLSAIFEEFEQADETTSRTYGGSGLGLAIVKRLVPLMNGRIDVWSEPGVGSTFTVTLQLAAATDEEKPQVRRSEGSEIKSLAVLLVSAAPFEGDYLEATARSIGAHVTRIADAADAQQSILDGLFDVLVVDLAIGAEKARELAILARAAGFGRRIIILSPSERRTFGAPAASGFDAFLVKPVRGRSLLLQLRETGTRAAPGLLADFAPAEPVEVDRPRVLLAEDNEINALLARRTLEKLGAEPVWVPNGREAVDLVVASMSGQIPPFALGVFDVRMPVLDGLKAARLIRDEESALGMMIRMPLIAVTANVSAEDRQAAMAAGFDDCLPKPLVRDQLALWLKIALDPAHDNGRAGRPDQGQDTAA